VAMPASFLLLSHLSVPAFFTHDLAFRSGWLMVRIFRCLNHVVENTAFSAGGDFQIDCQFKVSDLPARHQRPADLFGPFAQTFTLAYNHPVFNDPKRSDLVGIVSLPAVERLSIEQQLPAGSRFGFR